MFGAMIKFVCATCGERLSVPDGHGGRKGVCPVCLAVNRIPLKGYAQTQPNTPVVAKLAQSSAPATPLNGGGAILPMTAVARPHQERSLPKPLKVALLVIAALAIVGAIWLALYLALRWAVPMN